MEAARLQHSVLGALAGVEIGIAAHVPNLAQAFQSGIDPVEARVIADHAVLAFIVAAIVAGANAVNALVAPIDPAIAAAHVVSNAPVVLDMGAQIDIGQAAADILADRHAGKQADRGVTVVAADIVALVGAQHGVERHPTFLRAGRHANQARQQYRG